MYKIVQVSPTDVKEEGDPNEYNLYDSIYVSKKNKQNQST